MDTSCKAKDNEPIVHDPRTSKNKEIPKRNMHRPPGKETQTRSFEKIRSIVVRVKGRQKGRGRDEAERGELEGTGWSR